MRNLDEGKAGEKCMDKYGIGERNDNDDGMAAMAETSGSG